jgi:uncharacterized protein (DUF2384 family)
MTPESKDLKPDRPDQTTATLAAATALSSVIRRALQVIGDEAEAMRWLGTPVRALSYATAISLPHDANGRKSVLNVLGRLEHGVL